MTTCLSLILALQLAFGLEDGTPVKLRLSRTISSADAQVDDRVDFDVLEEIKIGDTVVIPKGAVQKQDGRDIVYVVRDGRAERCAVSVGSFSGEEVLVVAGVSAGERVLAKWPEGLRDGLAVREQKP